MATQQELDEAKKALHRLMIGKRAVSLTYEGESVTYTRADEGMLRRYIAGLEKDLGLRRCVRIPGVGV